MHLSSLVPCSRYIAGVSVLNANWTSVPPRNWLRFRTSNDPRAPPSNFKYDLIGRTIRFSWQHNCQLKGTQPSQYLFRINNLSQNTNETHEIDGLNFVYRMARGAEYSFEVSTPHPQAVPAIQHIVAPPNRIRN